MRSIFRLDQIELQDRSREEMAGFVWTGKPGHLFLMVECNLIKIIKLPEAESESIKTEI